MRLIAFVATATCLLAVTAPAAEPSLPATVAKDLKAVADVCTEAGGKAKTADAVKRVDLNGDGKDDFVIDVGSINCDGAASVYGDREKGVLVYVGDGAGGATQAFNDSTYGAKIEGGKLWLSVSGQQCGKKPAKTFAEESFCERPIAWNAKAKKFQYAPVSTVKMVQ